MTTIALFPGVVKKFVFPKNGALLCHGLALLVAEYQHRVSTPVASRELCWVSAEDAASEVTEKMCRTRSKLLYLFACQSILLSPSLLSSLPSLSSLLLSFSLPFFPPLSFPPYSFLCSLPSFICPLPSSFLSLFTPSSLLIPPLPLLLLPPSILSFAPSSLLLSPFLPSLLFLLLPSLFYFPLPPSFFHHSALPSLLTPSSLLTPPLPLLPSLPPSQEGSCRQCFCRPMWCFSCMSKWFAARQNQQQPETWMGSTAPCPMCRAQFCVLDVLALQGVQLE